MHILLTLHHCLDPNAGAASVTLKLGEAYRKLGHTVSFYSFDNLPTYLPKQFISLIFPFFVAYHIISTSLKVDIDVIHASSVDSWVWGFILRRFCFRNAPVLVTQSHGLEHTMHERILEEAASGKLTLSWKYPLYNGSLLLWKAEISFQMADFSFILNHHDAEILQQKLGVAADKIKVFPNGIPDAFIGLPFEPLPEGCTPGIAFIGSYIERKGIRYGVPALDQVMQDNPQVKAIFLGTGCSDEVVLRDFSPEVRDRVSVVPSFEKSDLPALLKGFQILLFPSLSEGFPLALPEAMACGLAPVATNIPGPTEIVKDAINGLLIDARNQPQTAAAMLELLSNRPYLEQLRVKAYESVQSYSWHSIAIRHLALYASAIESN